MAPKGLRLAMRSMLVLVNALLVGAAGRYSAQIARRMRWLYLKNSFTNLFVSAPSASITLSPHANRLPAKSLKP